MSSYYQNPETGALDADVTVAQRLAMYLNGKSYYSPQEFNVYLRENGLEPDAIYNKDTDLRRMLCTVLEVLDSLANNIDLFRTVESEFATTSEAYNYLERRMQKLRQRIAELPEDQDGAENGGDFSFIFKDL